MAEPSQAHLTGASSLPTTLPRATSVLPGHSPEVISYENSRPSLGGPAVQVPHG